MRFSFKFFNYETGFFLKRRFSFKDLFTKAKSDENLDILLSSEEKSKWKLEFDIEKRIQAITGYNFETKTLEEAGTCLLKWLFRDVHTNVLHNRKYFDAVMDVPLENTENWREILVRNDATDKQIQVFNTCCGNKLQFIMEEISTKDYELFVRVMHHYKKDSEFNILIKSIGDL